MIVRSPVVFAKTACFGVCVVARARPSNLRSDEDFPGFNAMSGPAPLEPARTSSLALPVSVGLHTPLEGSLRVATLNLWCDADERRARHQVAGQIVSVLGADVLLVQEVPSGTLEDTLETLVAESGLSVASITPDVGGNRNAVLSRLPFTAHPAVRYTVPESPYDQFAACASVTTPTDRRLLLVSAHLMWGGLLEHRRVLQASFLDVMVSRMLEDPSAPAVLGGDFNTPPASSTVRHLTGLEPFEGRTAQWVDAFAKAGVGSGVTSTGENRWARTTALRHGFLEPSAILDRRIDFLFVRGYVHGRAFAPLRCFSVSPDMVSSFVPSPGVPPSDHDMVVADLWDPPLPSGHVP